MLLVVMDGVGGDAGAAVAGEGFAGVGVDVEAGEVGGTEIDTDAVAFFENVRGGVHADSDGVDFVGLHEGGVIESVAVAGALDAVGDVEVEAGWVVFGGGIDVD